MNYYEFDGNHPDVSGNYQNRLVSVKHNLIYSLITIRLATYFDLQTGRSRVRFPMVSLQFFIDITLPAALWPWG